MRPHHYYSGILPLLLFNSRAAAHMNLQTPTPFELTSVSNSPLEASGSDFPCRTKGTYTVGERTTLKVGDKLQMTFSGSAVHSGGSCQISVTTDKEPTKDTKWHVIHSVVGECPTKPIDYTIPAEVPDGELTLAWTWFNKVGNREMYMECAPITVSGGASDASGLDTLPDMLVANIASINTCKAPESSDYLFPNPGKYVTTNSAKAVPFQGECGSSAESADGESAEQAPAQAPAPAPVASTPVVAPAPPAPPVQTPASAPVASTPVAAPVPSVAPISSAPVQEPPTASACPGSSNPTVSATPKASKPVAAPAPAIAPAPVPATNGPGCSPDGILVCSGPSLFGLCDHGKVQFQPVAAGTQCVNGAIMRRSVIRADRGSYNETYGTWVGGIMT